MQTTPITRLRGEAKRQLYSYRKNTARAYRNPAQRTEDATAYAWVHAIDAARAYFRANDPLKERFMVRLFGLETAIARNQLARARMLQLEAELCVSVSTLYRWREDIFEIILFAAIESGLLFPFGLERKSRESDTVSAPHD